ncbi:uncharacterized protein LOC127282307 [Leptopilina boulardi]|uniref:uncharacterized protein LOC127282307 n=1 Tax=Leptopilina boulardi TaxID=63433 RepID=UPI0021F660BE|nr:uncharacterized protein LOC127282307 [Leptopilina boulardi]
MARRQFFALERRLTKNPELKTQYCSFMGKYKELGHMEEVKGKFGEGYYMPHQAVVREASLTSKLRVVFNASAKSTTGISLNDALMVGPTIQTSLFSLILRFRQHPIAFSADIEKMYRQFWIHPEDRKYQKILWRDNPNEPLKTYQLTTVTYGTSAAPFLAVRTLNQLAIDEGTSFPLAAKTLTEDFYVDDMMTGDDTLDQAEQRKNEWSSNHPDLIKDIQDESNDGLVKLDPESSTKALGVSWNSREDVLIFEVKPAKNQDILTKKTMLSQIAQLYDPLGIVAPVITYAKIQMQILWKLNIQWDDPVPENIVLEWNKYQEELPSLNHWKIPRTNRDSDTEELQLHGFADASEKAYCACIYLRASKGQNHRVLLLTAKSRVAPIKTVSLPRLELCAAVTLAKLFKSVKESLRVQINREVFWSDSTIALSWISSSPHELKTFVANRVAEIQSLTPQANWKHVSSEDNPADYVSRGQLPGEFVKNEMWKFGPKWLSESESCWPEHPLKKIEIPEKRSPSIISMMINNQPCELWTKFSSWTKLLRIMALCIRFMKKLRKQSCSSGLPSPDELSEAKNRILGLVQQEEFSKEIKKLTKNENLPGQSKLIKLNPIIVDKLMRVGGRIRHPDLELQQKHPILLPKNHPLTTLIIREFHEKYLHAGANGTLYAIRNEFWPIDGRLAVRKVLHNCVRCFRVKPKEINYQMANLPKWHFSPPRTPHFGGVWEAAVKSLKHHLKRTIGETLFTFEELSTYMCEIEAVLNSRPLTPISSDPNDLQALTPGHFLIGDALMTIPTLDYSQIPVNRLSTWQHMQKLKVDLWNRWHREYLNELNVRGKWHTGSPNLIKISTLVVVHEDNVPPMRWKLGRVLETHPGNDGVIRVVTVKTENGIVKRGVKKISPLPIAD